MKTIKAGVLEVAHLEFGRRNGWPVLLQHGFPFDVQAYKEVAIVGSRQVHNLPQEAPAAFADAVLTVRAWLLDELQMS